LLVVNLRWTCLLVTSEPFLFVVQTWPFPRKLRGLPKTGFINFVLTEKSLKSFLTSFPCLELCPKYVDAKGTLGVFAVKNSGSKAGHVLHAMRMYWGSGSTVPLIFNLSLDAVNGQPHALALLSPGRSPTPIEEECGWVSKPVWTSWIRRKSVAPARYLSTMCPVFSP
jgi:hypothetical protein